MNDMHHKYIALRERSRMLLIICGCAPFIAEAGGLTVTQVTSGASAIKLVILQVRLGWS